MRQLLPLRDELLLGDLRALYLDWLAGADSLPDKESESEVPPDLADITPPRKHWLNLRWVKASCGLGEGAASCVANFPQSHCV